MSIHINQKTFNKKAAATSMKGGLLVAEWGDHLVCVKYTPSALGLPENREEYNELFSRAAKKIGWKRDRRCKGGWRKFKGNLSKNRSNKQ